MVQFLQGFTVPMLAVLAGMMPMPIVAMRAVAASSGGGCCAGSAASIGFAASA